MWSTLSFLALRRLLRVFGLGPKPDDKDVEIAVLRHQLARGVLEIDQGLDQRVRRRGGHVLARFPVAPRVSSTPGCDGRGRARGFGCPTCPRPQCRAQAPPARGTW